MIELENVSETLCDALKVDDLLIPLNVTYGGFRSQQDWISRAQTLRTFEDFQHSMCFTEAL